MDSVAGSVVDSLHDIQDMEGLIAGCPVFPAGPHGEGHVGQTDSTAVFAVSVA